MTIYQVTIEPADERTEVFVTTNRDGDRIEITTIEMVQRLEDDDFQDVLEGVLSTMVKDAIAEDFVKREGL